MFGPAQAAPHTTTHVEPEQHAPTSAEQVHGSQVDPIPMNRLGVSHPNCDAITHAPPNRQHAPVRHWFGEQLSPAKRLPPAVAHAAEWLSVQTVWVQHAPHGLGEHETPPPLPSPRKTPPALAQAEAETTEHVGPVQHAPVVSHGLGEHEPGAMAPPASPHSSNVRTVHPKPMQHAPEQVPASHGPPMNVPPRVAHAVGLLMKQLVPVQHAPHPLGWHAVPRLQLPRQSTLVVIVQVPLSQHTPGQGLGEHGSATNMPPPLEHTAADVTTQVEPPQQLPMVFAQRFVVQVPAMKMPPPLVHPETVRIVQTVPLQHAPV